MTKRIRYEVNTFLFKPWQDPGKGNYPNNYNPFVKGNNDMHLTRLM
jgi:hypothetical protein